MTELRDLEVFAKVAQLRSMTAAAAQLGMTTAVISKRIQRLEERLAVRLLQRTTRQMTLTEAGQAYLERINGIVEQLSEAEQEISGRGVAAQGTLRVSAPTSFGRMHIAPHLLSYMRAHPKVKIDLKLSDEFTDIVAEGFDLAIRIAEPKDSSLVARRLAPVQRVLCASKDYIRQYGKPTSLEDLSAHSCLPQHNGDAWRLVSPEGTLVYRPTGTLYTNSSEVVREAVIAGMGIALRSTWDVGAELRNGSLVRVLPQYEGASNIWISAVYPSRQFLPLKVRSFIDFLSELYSHTPPWDQTHE